MARSPEAATETDALLTLGEEPPFDDALTVEPAAEPAAESAAAPRGLHPDLHTFTDVYAAYQGPLQGYIQGLVHNTELAADLMQETFTRAYRSIGAEGPIQNGIGGLLYRIAYHAAIDELRRAQKHPVAYLSQPVRTEAGSHLTLEETLAEMDSGQDVAHEVEARLGLAAILGHLSNRESRAAVLHYHYGVPQTELAATEQLPPSTVKVRMWHARNKARQYRDEHDL